MANFKRRFTKDEFKQELFEHLRSIPPGHLNAPKKLEAHAEKKAEHYVQALAALDRAAERLRAMAADNPGLQADTDACIKEINDAVDTYGEVSLYGNSIWENGSDPEG